MVPHNFDTVDAPTRCDVMSSDGQDVDDSYSAILAGDDGEIVNLATATYPAGTTVSIQSATGAASMYYQRDKLVVLRIGALHRSAANVAEPTKAATSTR
jgi:hypothetical protein